MLMIFESLILYSVPTAQFIVILCMGADIQLLHRSHLVLLVPEYLNIEIYMILLQTIFLLHLFYMKVWHYIDLKKIISIVGFIIYHSISRKQRCCYKRFLIKKEV